MESFFNNPIFSIGDWSLSLGQLALAILLLILFLFLYRKLALDSSYSAYFDKNEISEKRQRTFHWIVRILLVAGGIYLLLRILRINHTLYSRNDFNLTIQYVLAGLCLLIGARLIDWLFSNILIHKYYILRDTPKADKPESPESSQEQFASRIGQSIVYLLFGYLLLSNLGLDFSLFNYTTQNDGQEVTINFRFTQVLSGLLIILFARLVLWIITELFLYGVYNRKGMDQGSRFAINQLIKYFIYVISVFVVLDHVGINMTLIWTGAAALLVGIGLGLQQTFNDFISGVVLLFERTTSVGDILEFGDKVGQVKTIGLRASSIQTRQNKSVVVPNSQLVNENVVNWSHYRNRVRFEVGVGVAYGSDTTLVKKILLKTASEHKDVLKTPQPFVRFTNFGNSSLDFSLSFFSRNYLFIEDVKSDLRFSIDQAFREADISIPFPQMDIWYRNPPPIQS